MRHVTGADGQALGQMRYTPFGEITEQTGAISLFGFTGEAQGGLSGLVYLRARYYNPSLGRFQTQDSLIPDVTNGQALNAYAYVYNDPVNMVDPSGNIPGLGGVGRAIGDAVVGAAKRAPDAWKPWIRDKAQAGLDFLDRSYKEPASTACSCQDAGTFGFYGPIAWVTAQGAWEYISRPAGNYGSFVIEAQFEQQVASWWRNLPGMQSRLANKLIPRSWGYKTVTGPWEPWPGTARTGWIDDIVPSTLDRTPGTHALGKGLRYRISSEVKWKNGLKGAAGATLISGLLEGALQGLLDSGLCLSQAERLYRIAIATGLGLLGGGLAAGVFALATGSTMGILGIPVLAGLAVGFGVSALMDRFEVKEKLFDLFPN